MLYFAIRIKTMTKRRYFARYRNYTMHLYFSLQVGTAFAVTNLQFENLALHLQGRIEKLALQSYFSSLFAEQCQTSLNKKR